MKASQPVQLTNRKSALMRAYCADLFFPAIYGGDQVPALQNAKPARTINQSVCLKNIAAECDRGDKDKVLPADSTTSQTHCHNKKQKC
jgi:hypothetical protein